MLCTFFVHDALDLGFVGVATPHTVRSAHRRFFCVNLHCGCIPFLCNCQNRSTPFNFILRLDAGEASGFKFAFLLDIFAAHPYTGLVFALLLLGSFGFCESQAEQHIDIRNFVTDAVLFLCDMKHVLLCCCNSYGCSF